MIKKMMLLALTAVSAAMFAMPGVAAATPNHIDAAEPFTVASAIAGNLSTTDGKTVNCVSTSGSGAFTTTTGGTMSLVFHGCTTTILGVKANCTSTNPAGGTTGTIRTTENLRFDLIKLTTKVAPKHVPGENLSGILVTPPANSTQFAHFACARVNFTVEGNGVIGTIKSPLCGAAATTTATFDFDRAPETTHGYQEHTTYTGTSYDLTSGGSTAAMDAEATATFKNARKLVCT